ncbi:MAG: NHLP bacteriocin system secretion protein [Chitinophagales bacterium]
MAREIFRKSALERLSTPEKLDQLVKITNPRAWLILLALGLAIGTALLWSVLGTIKTRVDGAGILLGGGVYDVVSNTSGQIIDIATDLGDTVVIGDVIAVVEQVKIKQQIAEAKARLGELNAQYRQVEAFGSTESKLQSNYLKQQKSSLRLQKITNEKNLAFLQQQVKIEEDLLAKGLITQPEVIATRQKIDATKDQNKQVDAQIAELEADEIILQQDRKKELTLNEQRINEVKRQIGQLEEEYEIETKVLSQYGGIVLEVLSERGDILSPGVPLLKVDNSGIEDKTLRCVFYLPSKDGKKVLEGMEVLVSPATVRPQEFGYMKGKITYVSDYPTTPQGMRRILKNEQLVQELSAIGAPFEVYAELTLSEQNFSGYTWTSAGGPEVQIFPGTPCYNRVTITSQHPIELIIPAAKQFFQLM